MVIFNRKEEAAGNCIIDETVCLSIRTRKMGLCGNL